MKKLTNLLASTAIALTVAGALAGSAFAQDARGKVEMTRANVKAARLEIAQANMNLTTAEGAKFWPIYKEYQAEITKKNDKLVKMLGDFVKSDKPMSDGDLMKAMDTYLGLEKDTLTIRQKYAKKLRGAVPAIKVARWLQIESKMDAVVKFDLATNVPLAE